MDEATKLSCKSAKTEEIDLRHKKLRHANYDMLFMLGKKRVVMGIVVFQHKPKVVCSECKIRKQIRTKHSSVG